MLAELIKLENINLDLQAQTKDELFEEMATKLNQNGYIKNVKKFKKDLYKRESEGNTGIGFGIGIPHAKSKYVKQCCIGIGVSKQGIDYDAIDGEKVHLIFMLAIEGHEADLHLQALAALSRKLIHEDFREKLLNASSKEEIFELICEE